MPDSHVTEGRRPGQFFSIQTRSIRLGSFKVISRETTLFTATGIQIQVPDRFKQGQFFILSQNATSCYCCCCLVALRVFFPTILTPALALGQPPTH